MLVDKQPLQGGKMLASWLSYSKRNPSTFDFDVFDVLEISEAKDEIIRYISRVLLLEHGSPTMIKSELRILADDAKELGLEIIKEYVEKQILPDKDETPTRVGNFGEIIAARILIEFEGFWFPIHKLRFREKRNWSMRLTDIFCVVKKQRQANPLICYGEVKTKSAGRNLNLAVEGHDSLVKDDALHDPEVLRFLCTHLYELRLLEEAEFFSKIRLGKQSYDRRHDLFLIHDKTSWTEDILGRLQNHSLNADLVDFSVKVVLVSNLKSLIEKTYEQVGQALPEILND